MEKIAVNRKLWLDALRGVAMILVVYGHSIKGWTEFYVFTSPVKMPLFFLISAYLFNPRSGNLPAFFKNIFWKLVLPWVILGMFPYTHPVDRVLNLLSGKAAWFMPCLIIAETLWFYIHKLSRSTAQVVIMALLASGFGFAMHHFHVMRYAMTDTAFVVQAFFVLGLLIKKYEQQLSACWMRWLPAVGVVYILIGGGILMFWPGESLDVHLNKYFNIPVCAMMIVLGCMCVFMLFKVRNLSPRWLVYIGQNTLLIYLLHDYFLGAFYRASIYLPVLQTLPQPLFALLKASFAIAACCALAVVVNKYCPVIVGKKKKS